MGLTRRLVVVGWICLVGSSVGELAQWLVTPVPAAQGTATGQLAGVDGHAGAMRLGSWLDLLILLIIPAVLFVGGLAGGRRSKLATTGAVVTFFATLSAGYLLALDPIVQAAAGVSDRTAGAAVLSAYEGNPVVVAVTVVALAGEVIGFALLGIALIRSHRVPAWAGIALLISMPIDMVGEASGLKAVATVGYALRALAFVRCAIALSHALRAPAPTTSAVGPSVATMSGAEVEEARSAGAAALS